MGNGAPRCCHRTCDRCRGDHSRLLLLVRPSNGVGLAIISIGLVWLLVGVMAGGYVGTRAARQESGE